MPRTGAGAGPWRFVFLIAVLWAQPVRAVDRPVGRPFATRSEVIAQKGMAATSQPLATQAAMRILEAGGTAVDAAIAANAVLGLVEPTGGGVGGDLFAIVWDGKTKRLYGLNASGPSPKGRTLEWLQQTGYTMIPHEGPLPVSVPGSVDGWFKLHEKFGRLPMGQILDPAIRYGREGFPISSVIARVWALEVKRLSRFENFAETFTVHGRIPITGDIVFNPMLADTLEKIALGGREAFYEGEIARTIAAYMQRNGGFLSYEDLAGYHSEWVTPISTNYRGYDVWQLPPNGQGLAVLQMLNILEQFNVKALGFGTSDLIHLFTEAKKLVYEDRALYYADPAFSEVPVERLLSKEYAGERAALIDPLVASPRFVAGEAAINTDATVYLTVADSEGTMVSLIQSNFSTMGSGMTPDGLGFTLQNRGELFNLDPTHANVYAPGKRPFNTIIPAFVTQDGKPRLAFGVMGGDMQPQGQVEIIMNLVDFGMNLQEAGDAPRICHTGSSEPTGAPKFSGGTLFLESGYPAEIREQLEARGHVLGATPSSYGGYQAIGYNEHQRVYRGATESRKDGTVAGY